MSYCRWSSDNFDCDIYAYESVHNCYTIHVARNRITSDVIPLDFRKPNQENIRAHRESMNNVVHENIGLPFDGQSFDEPDLESFKERLLELRAAGYRFPDYVLEEIDEELKTALPTDDAEGK